jgi:hypothetical protein
LPGRHHLVPVVYNILLNLSQKGDQVRRLANAARHLDKDSVFVVEAAFAGEWKHHSAHYIDAETIRPDRSSLDLGKYDPVTHDPVTQILTE